MLRAPIKNITRSAEHVSIGDFNMPGETKRTDEIGDLDLAIVRMQESILSVFGRRRSAKRVGYEKCKQCMAEENGL